MLVAALVLGARPRPAQRGRRRRASSIRERRRHRPGRRSSVTFFYTGDARRPGRRSTSARTASSVDADRRPCRSTDQRPLGRRARRSTPRSRWTTDALIEPASRTRPTRSSTASRPTDQIAIVTLRRRRSTVVPGLHHRRSARPSTGDRRRRPRRRRDRAVGRHRAGRPRLLERPATLQPNIVADHRRRRRRLDGHAERRRGARSPASAARCSPSASSNRAALDAELGRASSTEPAAGGHRDRRPRRRRGRPSTTVAADARRNQYVVTYASTVDQGPVDDRRSPSAAQRPTQARTSPGRGRTGAAPLDAAEPSASRRRPAFLQQRRSASRSASARARRPSALGAFSLIVARSSSDDASLDTSLQPYAEGYVAPSDDEDDERRRRMAQTALLQRAVELTEQLRRAPGLPRPRSRACSSGPNLPAAAGRGAVLLRRRRRRRSACWPACSLGSLARRSSSAGPRGAAPAGASSTSWPTGAASSSTAQLPDTLQLLAGTLRAGYSLMQGVEAVSQEVAEPDGPGAAPGRHRGPPRPAARGGARRRRRAHGQRRLRLGRHGHPHPARGRRQPGRAAADRGRDDDPARAAAPRRRRAHRRGQDQRHRPRPPARRPRRRHVHDQPRATWSRCSTRRIGNIMLGGADRARWSSASAG